MDLFDFFLQSGLITSALVVYLLFFKKRRPNKGVYRTIGWNYPLKLLCARYYVRSWKSQLKPTRQDELPRSEQYEGYDSVTFRTSAPDGSVVFLGIRKLNSGRPVAEITLHIKLADGTSYRLPQHPDTAICAWENAENAWSAGGLKIQVLEEKARYRVLYNGLLTRDHDGTTQHAKLNLIWATSTYASCYPEDWNNQLAAEALALEPWRDDKWPFMLGKFGDGGWHHWGTLQGRLQTFNDEGILAQNVYLRTRGVKDRSWSPQGYEGLRRTISIVVMAADGTGIQLRCLSHKGMLTQCISGTVRFPDSTSRTISYTDLVMSDFCERADGIPRAYAINVSTSKTDLRLVLRINPDGGKLYSGVPYKQELVYRTFDAVIDCSPGTGILELGYEPSVTSEPSRIAPPRALKWLSEQQAGDVGYCLSFEDRAAACPMLVGGKGASLALLASVQQSFRVPPGFCLATKALEKHLEVNPQLLDAIREIEAANEDYNEDNFKDKCKKAAELFVATEIKGDVKDEILNYMSDLRTKATAQKLSTELRFAVRSSAVGEDSEELSAAGQNETILGCVTDDDVILGVQKCWASMFAFTSAYYRRQNGQPCLCGGGVVVQALVVARAAGVMFTRHPTGDPSRLLITANYGLGESVVSGAVEPDTIIVRRDNNGQIIDIGKMEVGTKKQRVKTEGSGIAMEDVPENERNVACLTDEEVLKLANIGVRQEELWGAGRDIEWAVTENEIFLLQARPITSLERWTEEELLHEMDTPIMSDDELVSFGNTGEVLPKALSPMSYDVVTRPLSKGMDAIVGHVETIDDQTIILTSNRCAIGLYSTIYRLVPEELDVSIRMIEMAIHGHKVADQHILNVAKHRYPPQMFGKVIAMYGVLKAIISSKSSVNDSIKVTKDLNYELDTNDPEELFRHLLDSKETVARTGYNHGVTSSASSGSQLLAMNIFIEGKQDFTPDQCNEISGLFSSGDVLSAEVPVLLAKLTQKLSASGLAEQFRAQDPKHAMQWLKTNIPDVYTDVQSFLDQHGYRAIMEFDLVTKPWVLVPEDMMKVLQSLRVTESTAETKKPKSDKDILDSLTTIEKPSTKKILRWVLPLCRRTVRHRESTKAHLILAIHKIRLGFIKLGRLLVKHWYIPQSDLVFFFRLHELKDYIKTRDPALLKKAMQRQQHYPAWCKLKFHELNTGWVSPVEAAPPRVAAGDVRLDATSVCGGEVVARACVVKDLSEIGDLRQGDILITHSTDIGWSPYFPLLTGIVTELGGLISHGAVIAREYGLPCIVGAAYATDVFKTGDTVRLSGIRGTVERVIVEEKQENKDD